VNAFSFRKTAVCAPLHLIAAVQETTISTQRSPRLRPAKGFLPARRPLAGIRKVAIRRLINPKDRLISSETAWYAWMVPGARIAPRIRVLVVSGGMKSSMPRRTRNSGAIGPGMIPPTSLCGGRPGLTDAIHFPNGRKSQT
jgi:hypothetical protein